VTVNNSTFTSSVGDNLLVQYLNGSQSSTMTLDSEQNTFTNNQAGTAAIRVNWNGSLTATVDQTTTTGTGGSNLGVQLNNQSLTGSTTATITSNTFNGNGGKRYRIPAQRRRAGPGDRNRKHRAVRGRERDWIPLLGGRLVSVHDHGQHGHRQRRRRDGHAVRLAHRSVHSHHLEQHA
jgi:hypothetical protein